MASSIDLNVKSTRTREKKQARGAPLPARASLPLTGPALFLSPHYDDVVLSCGGTVASLVDQGREPLMITLFGGEITDDCISEFALWKHSRWGAKSVEEILAKRQREDAAAAEVLGCETLWLGFPDAIYRGDRYDSDPVLFGRPRDFELTMVDFIVEEVRSLPVWGDDASVFVPMGIGNHVDHQLTFEAGRHLARAGVKVFAYEDCPYSIHTPQGLDRRLEDVRQHLGEPILVNVAPVMTRRIGAIEAYGSQVPVIFRFTDDMPGAVRGFAERVGEGTGPSERFWPILG